MDVGPLVVGLVRAAVYHNVLPAAISEAWLEGGCQVSGSSCTNAWAGINELPLPFTRLKARTRKPLTRPSVPLKRKLIVFVPTVTSPAGRFIVIFSVLNPPPIPP